MILKPILAAGLNILFPGLGFIQSGKKKSIRIFYSGILFVILGIRFFAVHLWIFYFLAVCFVLLWLWMIADSFISAFQYDPSKKSPVKWPVYFVLLAAQLLVGFYLRSPLQFEWNTVSQFRVSSPNMSPALRPNDLVSCFRTKNIKRNDVIAFKFPQDKTTFYLTRCVAIPGDSIQITEGEVMVNRSTLPRDYELQYGFLVSTGEIVNERIFKKLEIEEYFLRGESVYNIHATDHQAEELKNLPFIGNVRKNIMPVNERQPRIFPDNPSLNWNTDFYGPVYIPAKGDRIQVNEFNLSLYRDIIVAHENIDAYVKDGKLYVNGDEVKEYVFQQNYYFGMGDNRHNSLDSRFWGFIPENLIFGKAIYRYWANDLNRVGKI